MPRRYFDCETCDGTGKQEALRGLDPQDTIITTCSDCLGTGHEQCEDCHQPAEARAWTQDHVDSRHATLHYLCDQHLDEFGQDGAVVAIESAPPLQRGGEVVNLRSPGLAAQNATVAKLHATHSRNLRIARVANWYAALYVTGPQLEREQVAGVIGLAETLTTDRVTIDSRRAS